MLTGAEIRVHEFKKGVRGYLIDDVDEFMEQIIHDFDVLHSENNMLKEKVENLEATLEHYKNLETTMNNSLLAAQQAADIMKDNAHKEVELIVEKSKVRMTDLFAVYQDVIRRINMMNLDMKAQISTQMELLEKTQKRMEALTDYFYGEDFKTLMENLDQLKIRFTRDDEPAEG